MPTLVWEQKSRDSLKAFIKKNLKTLAMLEERDAVEADTRTFVTDMLVEGFGYDKYLELTSEMRIQHEFADIGIRLDQDEVAIVEIKRVKLNLKEQQLRQVKTYAANKGLSWAILTNGRIWQVYRISETTPITDHLMFSVDLLGEDSVAEKAEKLWLISREAMKRGLINNEWKTVSALSTDNVKSALLSEASMKAIRAQLRADTQQLVDPDKLREVINGLLR